MGKDCIGYMIVYGRIFNINNARIFIATVMEVCNFRQWASNI